MKKGFYIFTRTGKPGFSEKCTHFLFFSIAYVSKQPFVLFGAAAIVLTCTQDNTFYATTPHLNK